MRAHDIRVFYRRNHVFLVRLRRLLRVGNFEQSAVRRALVDSADVEFPDDCRLVFGSGRRRVKRHARTVDIAAYDVANFVRGAGNYFVFARGKAAAHVQGLRARRLDGGAADLEIPLRKKLFKCAQIRVGVGRIRLEVVAGEEIVPIRIRALPRFVQVFNRAVLFAQHFLHFHFRRLVGGAREHRERRDAGLALPRNLIVHKRAYAVPRREQLGGFLDALGGLRLESRSKIVWNIAPQRVELALGFQRRRPRAAQIRGERNRVGRHHGVRRPRPVGVQPPLFEALRRDFPIIFHAVGPVLQLGIPPAERVNFYLAVVIIRSGFEPAAFDDVRGVDFLEIKLPVGNRRRFKSAHSRDANRPEEVAVRIAEIPLSADFRRGEPLRLRRGARRAREPAEFVAAGDVGAGGVIPLFLPDLRLYVSDVPRLALPIRVLELPELVYHRKIFFFGQRKRRVR